MPNKNIDILIKLNLSQENASVNEIIKSITKTLKSTTAEIIGNIINKIQENILDSNLGTKWNEFENKMVPWQCPHCLEQCEFVRRGKRRRKIHSSSGIIEFYLYRVTCKACNSTFCPFGQILGIEPRIRITKEFDEKILMLASNTSYNKTSKTIDLLLNEKISSTTVRNKVNTIAESIKISPSQDTYETILLDGTKVNANASERGIDIHLALAPTGTELVNGRRYNNKQLIGLSVADNTKSIKQQLKTVNCKNIITDGDHQYKKLLENVYPTANHKRCLWHIPHTLKHLLYLEKLPVEERGVLSSYASYILKEKDFMKAQHLYIDFMYWFKSVNMMSIYNYLYNAYNNIFINEDQWNDSTLLHVTSLVEREMREINRRTDIGCRWSRNGVENLLKIKLVQKYAPHTWEKYFPNMRSNNINTFAMICH